MNLFGTYGETVFDLFIAAFRFWLRKEVCIRSAWQSESQQHSK